MTDPTLPGFEHTTEERAEANAEHQGAQLSAKLIEQPKSISAKTGDLERLSPLFRGTEASGQDEMFPAWMYEGE